MGSTSLLNQLPGHWSAFDQHPILHAGLAFGLLLVGAPVLGRVARHIVLYTTNLLARQPALYWLGGLIRNKVFQYLAQTTSSLLVQFGLPWVPEMPDETVYFPGNLALASIVLFLILALTTLLNALLDIYARIEHAHTRPIKGYVQLTKIAASVFGAIIIISIIVNHSSLLSPSSLGAMLTVPLLVYKDTLMSSVTSVQLASNDMLRIGDWIEMLQVGADGDMMDITLYTVKVQNPDKTTISVSTWRLTSELFKNQRGMQQSGGRRIKQAIYIGSSQVRFLDEEEERHLSQACLLTGYMACKRTELQEWNAANGRVAPLAANRRRLANVGTSCAYVLAYLQNRPDVHPHMTCTVRQLQPTVQGILLEMYCFIRTTAWIDYEHTQGDIFDYLLVVMPGFGLDAYQHLSGQGLYQGLQGMLEGRNVGACSFEALAVPSRSDETTA